MNRIANPALMIKMLRDAGYKNTSYAVAELVDNSIEAKAKNISIALYEENVTNVRTQKLINEIAIFDDGEGMAPDILGRCLSFGWGTRLDGATGLGKFGFGLKGASISQARRIEIFSWQKEGDVHMTYLDCDEIAQTESDVLPEPVAVTIPQKYSKILKTNNFNSGTLIVWKNLDRLNPKKSSTLINHLNKDMCRIFRHFLDDNDVYGTRRKISVNVVDPKGSNDQQIMLKANDPLYLYKPNNLPGFENEATNLLDDEAFINVIDQDGVERVVHIISSIAKPEIQMLGGSSELGKHYANNNGISFVRAGRELELDIKGFFNNSEPRYRWFGIEIRFEPQLDEYFGVPNNKQGVRNFKNFDEAEIDDLLEQVENSDSIDSRAAKMKLDIHKCITNMVKKNISTVQGRGAGRRTKKTGGGPSPAEKFTKEVEEIDVGEKTRSNIEAENKSIEQKVLELAEIKMNSDSSLDKGSAIEIAKLELSNVIHIEESSWPGDTFLDVDYKANSAIGLINRRHAFFTEFYDGLRHQEDQKGFEALKLVLMAFVRCEDVLQHRVDPKAFDLIRSKWGEYLRNLSKMVN